MTITKSGNAGDCLKICCCFQKVFAQDLACDKLAIGVNNQVVRDDWSREDNALRVQEMEASCYNNTFPVLPAELPLAALKRYKWYCLCMRPGQETSVADEIHGRGRNGRKALKNGNHITSSTGN